jgi:hypothetical protein
MRQATYNSIKFPAAQRLMNTSTAPQEMNASFAQNITNLLPTKGGTLAIRHGTLELGSPTGDGDIMDIIPYVKSDGTSQLLVITDNGKIKLYDETLDSFTDVRTGLDPAGYYFWDYHNEGGMPKLVIVNGVDPNMIWDGTSITTMAEFVADTGASETWVSATQASIVTGELGAVNYPSGRKVKVTFSGTGLAVSGITRSGSTATVTTTADNNLQTGDYVTIAGTAEPEYNGTFQITSTGVSTFTYAVSGTPTTPATGAITYTIAGIQRSTTVSSTYLTGGAVRITFAASILPAVSVTITEIAFERVPEAFSYVFSGQGRLWAIPAGETHPTEFKDNTKRGYVYYTNDLNVINSWFSPVTMQMSFIDVSNTMNTVDEITAISEYREFMVFLGRYHIQFWAGADPSDTEKFGYANTFPVGLVHPKLMQRLPNELAFMTPYGLRTASLAVQSGVLEAGQDLGSAIDTTVTKEVESILSDADTYRSCRSFFYPKQGIYGFKFLNKTLVYQVREESRGWVEFTGDFKDCTAFVTDSSGKRLLMAFGQQLIRYADGTNTTTLAYSDRGEPIKWNWWTPWAGGQRRWANHAFEIIHNDSAQLEFEIIRLKNNSLGAVASNALSTSPVIGFWNEGLWDEALWDEPETVIPRIRDKFIAQTMSFVVRGETTVGPFEITSLTCYGQYER